MAAKFPRLLDEFPSKPGIEIRLADFGITTEIDTMETTLFVLIISTQKSSMKIRGEIDSMKNALFVIVSAWKPGWPTSELRAGLIPYLTIST